MSAARVLFAAAPERWDESRPLVPWLLGILGNRLKQSVHRARRTPDAARLNGCSNWLNPFVIRVL